MYTWEAIISFFYFLFFFFNDTATTEIYTLSLHDALPISTLPTTNRTNAAPSVYWRVLASRPSSRRSRRSNGLPPWRRRWPKRSSITFCVGITSEDTAFITYSAWPSTSDMNAVTRSITTRCSGVASADIRPAPSPWPRTTLTSSPSAARVRSRSAAGSVSMLSESAATSSSMCWRSHGIAVNCTRCVTSCTHTHSRKSDASTWSCRSTLTRFGATSRSCPSCWSKNSNWPSTLPDRKPSTAPACMPVTRPPTDSATLPTLFAATSLSTSGVMTVRIPPALTSIHPARSTTRVSAVTGGSRRWVSSPTCAAATDAQWYSSPTTASASAADTCGGGGLRLLADRAARSQ